MDKNRVPRIGLIGISGYGRVYLNYVEAAMARQEIQLVAATVINRDAEQEACRRLEAKGVALYCNSRQMLQDCRGKLDLCLIPIPIHLHEKVAVAALESGANVLLEKPLAASVAQAESIQEAERRTGNWVAVGYQDWYCPSAHSIGADLAAGRIGRVESIRLLGLWPRGESYYGRNDWAGKLALDGVPVKDSPLNNAMAHFLNLSLYWAGLEPGKIAWPESVEAELFRCLPIESFDTGVARIRAHTGIDIHVAVTHCCPVERPIHIEVRGSKGKLDWFHQHEAVWNVQGKPPLREKLENGETAVQFMFRTVLDRLTRSEARICTTSHATPQVACVEAIHESAAIRRVDLAGTGGNFIAENPHVIPAIEANLKSCLGRGAMPSELGFPWAPSPSAARAAALSV